MHSLIGVIEAGEEPGDAYVDAEDFLQSRLHSQIDYYVMCDDDDFRWGEYPSKPIEVHSEEGKKIVEELIQYTKKEVDEAIEEIRKELKKEEPDYENLFYHCRMASGNLMNAHLFLEGDPVVSWKQIEKMEKYLPKGQKFYLVLADVHI